MTVIRSSGFSAALKFPELAFQTLDTFFQACGIITQGACGALLGSSACAVHEQGFFFGEEFGDAGLEPVEHAAVGVADGLDGVGDTLASLVAKNAGEVFFDVPGKVLEDEADNLGKLRITLDGHPLDADTLRQLGRWQRFRPGFSRLSGRQSATFQPEGDGLGSAENPMAPAIGDLRIHWEELRLPPLADKLNLHQGRWVLIAGATAASDSPVAAAEPVAVVGFGWSWPRRGSWLLLLAAAAWLLWRRWRA